MRHPSKPNRGRKRGNRERPTRAHGAAGRQRIWAGWLGVSEAQVAWWSKLDRFSEVFEQALPGWRAVADADLGPQLRRELRAGSLGEGALFILVASYVQVSLDSPSQLQLMLNSSGSLEIRLQDDEGVQVTPDEGWMAGLLGHLIEARRRKRSRFRRARRLFAARLGLGPARLPEEDLRRGLAERGWREVAPEGRNLGVQQAYIFVLPDLAQFFSVQVAALLGCLCEDLRFDLAVCEEIATVVVYSDRWLWPPADLFDALEMVMQLAKERHGAVQELGDHGPGD